MEQRAKRMKQPCKDQYRHNQQMKIPQTIVTLVTRIRENMHAKYAKDFASVEMKSERMLSSTETALKYRDDHSFLEEPV